MNQTDERFTEINAFHTLRIEMMDGTVLAYRISEKEKLALLNWLDPPLGPGTDYRIRFIIFSALPNRSVFVRIKDIARLVFSLDMAIGSKAPVYIDNFSLLPPPIRSAEAGSPEDLDASLLPDMIVKLSGRDKPLVFRQVDNIKDYGVTCLEHSFRSLSIASDFLTIHDAEEEPNYIPLRNIAFIEARDFIVFPGAVECNDDENEHNT